MTCEMHMSWTKIIHSGCFQSLLKQSFKTLFVLTLLNCRDKDYICSKLHWVHFTLVQNTMFIKEVHILIATMLTKLLLSLKSFGFYTFIEYTGNFLKILWCFTPKTTAKHLKNYIMTVVIKLHCRVLIIHLPFCCFCYYLRLIQMLQKRKFLQNFSE